MAARRQRGELQPGRPAFCAGLECFDKGRVEIEPHHVVEEDGRLRRGEPQVHGAHLDKLAAHAQPSQREWRVRTGRDGEGGSGWQVVEQEPDGFMHGGRLDDVVVVQCEDRGPFERVEIVDEADKDVLCRERAVRLQQCQRVLTDRRVGGPERGDEVGEEPAWVVVGPVQ